MTGSMGTTQRSGPRPTGAGSANQTEEIAFVLASCQYPSGMLDQRVAQASYRRLAQRLDRQSQEALLQFLLLVGDQVYIDATAGLFDPTARFDRFRRPHEKLFKMLTDLNIPPRLPICMMMDDHEIEDNWEPVSYDSRPDPNMIAGRQSYLDLQRRAGPDQELPVGDSLEPLWCPFEQYGFPFFIADTRTERTPRTAETIESARIMSHAQFEKILCWLSQQPDDIPKFVASPSMVLPRRLRTTQGRHPTHPQREHPASALRSDAWDGYPYSLHRLVAYIVEKQIKNLVFLSGDEHLSCIAKATVTSKTGKTVKILSVHSSALYAPFPFANSVPADLAYDEKFEFDLPNETFAPRCEEREKPEGKEHRMKKHACDVGGTYTCEVRTEFAPGDGFAVLSTMRANGAWKLRCEFDRDPRTASISIDCDL